MAIQKKKRKHVVVTSVLVLIIIVLAILGFRCSLKENAAVTEFEQNVNEITEIDYSERQEAINAIVEEGKMNVNYSSKAIFEGRKSVLFNIKNIKNNHAPIIFEILDEDGECIYQSKKIEQGYEMNCIELEKELSKGIHECKIKIRYANEGNVASAFPLSVEVR